MVERTDKAPMLAHMHLEPIVACSQPVKDGPRRLLASVIDNDELKVPESLVKDRANSRFQIAVAIVRWHEDGNDGWHGHPAAPASSADLTQAPTSVVHQREPLEWGSLLGRLSPANGGQAASMTAISTEPCEPVTGRSTRDPGNECPGSKRRRPLARSACDRKGNLLEGGMDLR
jgi:hypothetical protein